MTQAEGLVDKLNFFILTTLLFLIFQELLIAKLLIAILSKAKHGRTTERTASKVMKIAWNQKHVRVT
jgi:hypothetical protein